MKLLAVCTGEVQTLLFRSSHGESAKTQSAIRKSAISTLDHPAAVQVGKLGVAGDEQYDQQVHGGPYKAVYCLPSEHYPFWRERRAAKQLSTDLAWGFLGENLVVEGLMETEVRIGDEYQIGSALLRVTQPREPCYKFAVVMGYGAAAKHMVQQGGSGWYFSVVRAGEVQAGDSIELVQKGEGPTVRARFDQLMNKRQMDLL